jgi:hypothetical protein
VSKGSEVATQKILAAAEDIDQAILRRLSAGTYPKDNQGGDHQRTLFRVSGVSAARRGERRSSRDGSLRPSGGCIAFAMVAPCRLRAASRRRALYEKRCYRRRSRGAWPSSPSRTADPLDASAVCCAPAVLQGTSLQSSRRTSLGWVFEEKAVWAQGPIILL